MELYAAYQRALRDSRYRSLQEILVAAVNSPAPRFFVSPKRARAVITDMFQGKNPLNNMHPTRQEMFREIFRRAQRIRQQYPTMSLLDIAKRAVNSPAPKFYLTPHSAKIILHHHRKNIKTK